MDEAGDGMIGPTTRNAGLKIALGTAGGTSRSIFRRLADSRFSNRYFVGNGLDIGGGADTLAVFQEMFPLMGNVVVYDRPQGDAQTLANVADGVFDFVYSSHCLEHMHDPVEALGNWIRVVRKGGHLVVAVPDEDLYEQGVWPSTFNGDHKVTFTICKTRSWSPVSINVLEMLQGFAAVAQPLSIMTIDHAHRFHQPRFDQTLAPVAESAIEFVLRKL